MLFTYSFGEKLDLTKFAKQGEFYIASMREVKYHIYLSHYRVIVEIAGYEATTKHIVSVMMEEITRDQDGELFSSKPIFPLLDERFKDNTNIQNIFKTIDNYRGSFESNNVSETLKKICDLIKFLHKINYLTAFL